VGKEGTQGLILQTPSYESMNVFGIPGMCKDLEFILLGLHFLTQLSQIVPDAVAEIIDMEQLFWGCSKVYVNQAPGLFLNEPRSTLFCLT